MIFNMIFVKNHSVLPFWKKWEMDNFCHGRFMWHRMWSRNHSHPSHHGYILTIMHDVLGSTAQRCTYCVMVNLPCRLLSSWAVALEVLCEPPFSWPQTLSQLAWISCDCFFLCFYSQTFSHNWWNAVISNTNVTENLSKQTLSSLWLN